MGDSESKSYPDPDPRAMQGARGDRIKRLNINQLYERYKRNRVDRENLKKELEQVEEIIKKEREVYAKAILPRRMLRQLDINDPPTAEVGGDVMDVDLPSSEAGRFSQARMGPEVMRNMENSLDALSQQWGDNVTQEMAFNTEKRQHLTLKKVE